MSFRWRLGRCGTGTCPWAGERGRPAPLSLGPLFPSLWSRVCVHGFENVNFILCFLGEIKAIIISEWNWSWWRCSCDGLSSNYQVASLLYFPISQTYWCLSVAEAAPGWLDTLPFIEFGIPASCSECVCLPRDGVLFLQNAICGAWADYFHHRMKSNVI